MYNFRLGPLSEPELEYIQLPETTQVISVQTEQDVRDMQEMLIAEGSEERFTWETENLLGLGKTHHLQA